MERRRGSRGAFIPTLLPATAGGRAAAWLLAGAVACFVAMNIAAMAGQTGGDTFFDNLWLSIPAIIAAVGVLAAAACAVYALTLQRERSAIVMAAFVIGVVALVFLIGEASGHG